MNVDAAGNPIAVAMAQTPNRAWAALNVAKLCRKNGRTKNTTSCPP